MCAKIIGRNDSSGKVFPYIAFFETRHTISLEEAEENEEGS